MQHIIQNIRAELKDQADTATQKSFQRFFKESVKCYGVKTGIVRKIARKYWPAAASLTKSEIFVLCEELYRSDYCEEAFVVSIWVPKLTPQFAPNDLRLFKKWIARYINNWAKCDGFCTHTLGNFIAKYPVALKEVTGWVRSDNRWLKRAAAVSLIVPAKKGRFLKEVFAIADRLLSDPDDMVQKGYGWLLKEASRVHQKDVLNYVIKNKASMPRTALRYAIELMPRPLKVRAMQKD